MNSSLKDRVREIEREEIINALKECNWVMARAARKLGITEYPGTYFNLSLSHSIMVYKDITFDLGASAGYFVGSDDYWKTYELSTGDYTGKKYSAFHDGMVKAGFTIPIAKNLSVQPVAQYWFPLSSKAKETVDGNSYNHNGKLDDTFVTGINLTFSF